MAVSRTQHEKLSVYRIRSYNISLWLFLSLSLFAGFSVYAQTATQIDSLPTQGLPLLSGWRWHPGDNPIWAGPTFDDSRWDTLRPSRNISRQEKFRDSPFGWLRQTFILDSAIRRIPLAATLNQIGASEIYIDGLLWQRMGKVASTYQEQIAYTPPDNPFYLLPPLSPGRHVIAIRLSQQRPPWYVPKFLYFTLPVFRITLFEAQHLSDMQARQLYTKAFGNYLLVGIFLILSVIHFLYYFYRRKRVNLVFGITTLSGASCIALIESLGLITDPAIGEWLIVGQGLLISTFMLMLLITYYVYLDQPLSWFVLVIAILLITPRLVSYSTDSWKAVSYLSILAMIGLFADGIRVSVAAIRANRSNARFMLTSILVMISILVLGSLAAIWLSTYLPSSTVFLTAIANLMFFLTLPVSFAIILAREHAQTNRNLEDRLTEVAQLSREKETILTQQNEILERQVKERTAELTQSLTELRETQQQLIQSEKMASLGELTAGIAHEIQNPLNFVNNFAEVSGELVQELKEESGKESRDQELEAEILDDLEQNLQKINHHGKRAASIVKSMLEHSRVSAGQREPTDVNALADEYLRLSYHGLRAKDKTFNAQLVSQLDPTIGHVKLVAQDVGRVFLNLFNNAFYAVQERQQIAPSSTYQPRVSLSTQQVDDGIEIRVGDNGMGIPDTVREKIFQPFFTTKPTGQGTGLGLSLSYDIITKGHSGKLTVETTPGEGTTFIIRLPDRR